MLVVVVFISARFVSEEIVVWTVWLSRGGILFVLLRLDEVFVVVRCEIFLLLMSGAFVMVIFC